MTSVNESNAIERERSRAQRIVVDAIRDLNTASADKAEVLAKHGHRNVPILFEKVELERILWGIAKQIRNENIS